MNGPALYFSNARTSKRGDEHQNGNRVLYPSWHKFERSTKAFKFGAKSKWKSGGH